MHITKSKTDDKDFAEVMQHIPDDYRNERLVECIRVTHVGNINSHLKDPKRYKMLKRIREEEWRHLTVLLAVFLLMLHGISFRVFEFFLNKAVI